MTAPFILLFLKKATQTKLLLQMLQFQAGFVSLLIKARDAFKGTRLRAECQSLTVALERSSTCYELVFGKMQR